MEDQIAVGRHRARAQRGALFIDQLSPLVEPRPRIGGDGRCAGHRRGGAELDENAALHAPQLYRRSILARRDVFGVKAESPLSAIGEPVPQGRAQGAEGDLLPGNPPLVEERYLERLLPGSKPEDTQPRAKLDAGARFLQRLAQRRLARRLVVLHEAGGQGPVAVAGLDGAPAEENFSFKFRNATYDQLGILVVDLAALVAHPSRQGVPGRHALEHRSRAIRTELHARSRRLLMVLSGVKPRRSTGAPNRLIQKTVKPKDLAPSASQQFDETKPMRSAGTPSLFTASSYTWGAGLLT